MTTSTVDQSWYKSFISFLDYSDSYIVKKLRKLDIWDLIYRLASASIAVVVALGEALTAAYFMHVVNLGAILAVAVPAFMVNFFLFNSDTYNFLKSSLQGKLFKDYARDKSGNKILDIDGNPIQVDFKGWQRWFLRAAMAISLFAGLLCGFVQLNSVLTTFGGLLYGLSAAAALSAPPLGLVVVAATVSIVSIIANAALLYANLEKFIREREYQNYIDTFKSILGLQQDKSKQLSIGWKFYHGIFAVCGVISAVGLYVISLGIYQAQAFKAFNSFLHLSVKTSNILTTIIANTGHLVNGFFYVRNIINFSQLLEDKLKKIAIIPLCFSISKYFHNKKLEDEINKTSSKENSGILTISMVIKELVLLPVSTAVFLGLLYCCYINGISQGQGAMSEPRSTAWLTQCLKMPQWLAEKVCFTLMATGSTSANAFACFDGILDILGFFGSSAKKINQTGQFVCTQAKYAVSSTVNSVVGFARSMYAKGAAVDNNMIENPTSSSKLRR